MTCRGGRRDGFTLFEVLAALLILAAASLAITRAVVVARGGILASDGYIGAEAVARTLLEGPVPLALRSPGRLSGTLEGHAYAMQSSPIEIPLRKRSREEGPRPEPAFVPLRIAVVVSAGARREVRLETVRLVPRQASP